MFTKFFQVIDRAKELQETLDSIEKSLGHMRSGTNTWDEEISRDKRPAVQILWQAHKTTIAELDAIRDTSILEHADGIRKVEHVHAQDKLKEAEKKDYQDYDIRM